MRKDGRTALWAQRSFEISTVLQETRRGTRTPTDLHECADGDVLLMGGVYKGHGSPNKRSVYTPAEPTYTTLESVHVECKKPLPRQTRCGLGEEAASHLRMAPRSDEHNEERSDRASRDEAITDDPHVPFPGNTFLFLLLVSSHASFPLRRGTEFGLLVKRKWR